MATDQKYPKGFLRIIQQLHRPFILSQLVGIGFVSILNTANLFIPYFTFIAPHYAYIIGVFITSFFAVCAIFNEFVDNDVITEAEEPDHNRALKSQEKWKNKWWVYVLVSVVLSVVGASAQFLRFYAFMDNALFQIGVSSASWYFMASVLTIAAASALASLTLHVINYVKLYYKVLTPKDTFERVEPDYRKNAVIDNLVHKFRLQKNSVSIANNDGSSAKKNLGQDLDYDKLSKHINKGLLLEYHSIAILKGFTSKTMLEQRLAKMSAFDTYKANYDDETQKEILFSKKVSDFLLKEKQFTVNFQKGVTSFQADLYEAGKKGTHVQSKNTYTATRPIAHWLYDLLHNKKTKKLFSPENTILGKIIKEFACTFSDRSNDDTSLSKMKDSEVLKQFESFINEIHEKLSREQLLDKVQSPTSNYIHPVQQIIKHDYKHDLAQVKKLADAGCQFSKLSLMLFRFCIDSSSKNDLEEAKRHALIPKPIKEVHDVNKKRQITDALANVDSYKKSFGIRITNIKTPLLVILNRILGILALAYVLLNAFLPSGLTVFFGSFLPSFLGSLSSLAVITSMKVLLGLSSLIEFCYQVQTRTDKPENKTFVDKFVSFFVGNKHFDAFMFFSMFLGAVLYFGAEFGNVHVILTRAASLGIVSWAPLAIFMISLINALFTYTSQLMYWGHNNEKYFKNKESNTQETKWLSLLQTGQYVRRVVWYMRQFLLCVVDIMSSLLFVSPVFGHTIGIVMLIGTMLNSWVCLYFQSSHPAEDKRGKELEEGLVNRIFGSMLGGKNEKGENITFAWKEFVPSCFLAAEHNKVSPVDLSDEPSSSLPLCCQNASNSHR